ncbi:hypothetical protein K461DRAFT_274096 [Myriangium duriaei CBS 260.36]|uniref:Uncharacterized protein n=1 Tax=Myriangium duriaei CBS 260.36 TaxID=1168546 RepID=A0A9P4JF49_9PEZI|nr:hypothetical protein K461DRAFT_274096 [Myriangium duriaei CBS 260.36]
MVSTTPIVATRSPVFDSPARPRLSRSITTMTRPTTPPATPISPLTLTLPVLDLGDPLPFKWTCHKCSTSYELGTTPRCLRCGHYFCAGETITRKGEVKRHKPCQSEFDYDRWSAWGKIRRAAGPKADSESDKTLTGRDCWNTCDYPSECRQRSIDATTLAATVQDKAEPELEFEPATEDEIVLIEEVVLAEEKKVYRKSKFVEDPDDLEVDDAIAAEKGVADSASLKTNKSEWRKSFQKVGQMAADVWRK